MAGLLVHKIVTNGFITLLCSYFTCDFTLQTNTFQCVLATSETESFVMFLYADGEIQWTNGALAGINAGDGVNSITIPGSLTPSIINITQTTNVGIPGVWMFQVDRGNTLIYKAVSI